MSDELSQLSTSNHGTFKLGVIQGMQQRGVNVVFGIGNAETDAFAAPGVGRARPPPVATLGQ